MNYFSNNWPIKLNLYYYDFLGDSILRKSVIAGNWKMHMTCAEAKSFLEEFIPLIKNIKDDRKVIIAPPFTAISTFSDHSDFNFINISSQNIHWEDQGLSLIHI